MKAKMIGLFAGLFILTTLLSGCVKVVKIGEEGKLTGEAGFSAQDNIAEVWDTAVVPELTNKAVDLPEFLAEANGDLKSLADTYGKYSMGTTGDINYVVKGSAVVTEVNQEKKAGFVVIKPNGYEGDITVKMQIGSVYKGSSVRDSLDFMKFGDYKNQQEWAAVSQSLHEVVNQDLIGGLDLDSITGKTIDFVGTFTASGNDEILITPVVLTVQ